MHIQPQPRRQVQPQRQPPATVVEEVHSLYSFLEHRDADNQPSNLKNIEGPGYLGCDRDRVAGVRCTLDRERSWFHQWHQLEYWGLKDDTKQKIKLPEQFEPDDLTLCLAHQKVAIQGFNPKSKQWEILQYRAELSPNLFTHTSPQVIHRGDHAFASIEYNQQGELLVAEGTQVKKLNHGKLETWLDCHNQVRDVSVLSDGGTSLFVASPGPAGSELLYLGPGSTEPVPLPLPPRFQEKVSPDGQASVVLTAQGGWPLSARTITQEFGSLLDPQAVAKNLPFHQGFDPNSASWSPDSRFFAVTSAATQYALVDLRDSLLWDRQSQQVHLLPGVHKVNFSEQGPIHLEMQPPRPQQQLQPDQLSQLNTLPWFQANQQQPMFTLQYSRPSITYRENGQTQGLAISSDYEFSVTQEKSHLVGIYKNRESAKIWDLSNGLAFTTPESRQVYWDKKHNELGLVAGQPPQLELIPGSQLSQTPWYRHSLEQRWHANQPNAEVQLPIEKTTEGTVFNGLKFPRKNPN